MPINVMKSYAKKILWGVGIVCATMLGWIIVDLIYDPEHPEAEAFFSDSLVSVRPEDNLYFALLGLNSPVNLDDFHGQGYRYWKRLNNQHKGFKAFSLGEYQDSHFSIPAREDIQLCSSRIQKFISSDIQCASAEIVGNVLERNKVLLDRYSGLKNYDGYEFMGFNGYLSVLDQANQLIHFQVEKYLLAGEHQAAFDVLLKDTVFLRKLLNYNLEFALYTNIQLYIRLNISLLYGFMEKYPWVIRNNMEELSQLANNLSKLDSRQFVLSHFISQNARYCRFPIDENRQSFNCLKDLGESINFYKLNETLNDLYRISKDYISVLSKPHDMKAEFCKGLQSKHERSCSFGVITAPGNYNGVKISCDNILACEDLILFDYYTYPDATFIKAYLALIANKIRPEKVADYIEANPSLFEDQMTRAKIKYDPESSKLGMWIENERPIAEIIYSGLPDNY